MSPSLLPSPRLPVERKGCNTMGRRASLRAGLIRANVCRFAERYDGVTSEDLVGEGAFGRVHCCTDRLARTHRAVKVVDMPNRVERRVALSREVASLVSLDHPHIVRLIEYFIEDGQLLLVMEMLHGPTLQERMDEVGVCTERFAARCARHMLKALFCCHCNGIAHNDVQPENFKFHMTGEPWNFDGEPWNLKMVDFGLSEIFSKDGSQSPDMRTDRGTFVQERDIWGAGVILFRLLAGVPLFPMFDTQDSGCSHDSLHCATDPAYVPERLDQLSVSGEAWDLLKRMLEPATHKRMTAREALLHPFITRFYAKEETDAPKTERARLQLHRWLAALRRFHEQPRLKKLALVIAAHLLTNNNDTTAAIHFLFRFLARDMAMVEVSTVRNLLETHQVPVPMDFSEMFSSADVAKVGGLTYVQFVASSIVAEPDLFCQESMLRAVFRFLDTEDTGVIQDGTLVQLFDMPDFIVWEGAVVEACSVEQASWRHFQAMMRPEGWQPEPSAELPADWADAPDGRGTEDSSDTGTPKVMPGRRRSVTNLVKSRHSESVAICQMPGFHNAVMRPYYDSQRVSNVVMGIVTGGSSYARTCALHGLAKILDVGGDHRGAFFMMPNPKYHWDPMELVKAAPRSRRYVAWWIAPMFLEELRAWLTSYSSGFSDGASDSTGLDSPAAVASSSSSRRPRPRQLREGLGDPGDFGFSDIVKPPGYLHTFRDLHGTESAAMLQALVSSVREFLEELLGETLSSIPVSAGFHYPVRPQYSTLHLQLRVNSGDVCGGDDRRGFDLMQLVNSLSQDPEVFRRDEEVLRYRATDNLRSAVLAASKHAKAQIEEVGPDSLVVRPPALPGPPLREVRQPRRVAVPHDGLSFAAVPRAEPACLS